MRPPEAGECLLSADALMAEARAKTGIDIDDTEVRERLARLLASLKEDGELHATGAQFMHDRFVLLLSNRLRLQRDLLAHPEIADEVIDRPIFVCGMARTGSTKTQKLLAASGDFNWLPYWQGLNPALITGARGEATQPRIDVTDEFVRRFDTASPEARFGHAFETHEPEEESFLLEHSFLSPVFMGWAPLNGYLDWLMRQDVSAQFLLLRDMLKYLQWQGLADRRKRWVLKSPLYSGLEDKLLAVFPDAKLLMTHRTPLETVASGLKLMIGFHKPYTDLQPDPAYYLAGQGAASEAHLRLRAALPAGTFHDIHFNGVMSDPALELRRIYAFIGEDLRPDAVRRMLDWNERSPPTKYGKHSYAMAEFGLDQTMIMERLGSYIAFLNANFPHAGMMSDAPDGALADRVAD